VQFAASSPSPERSRPGPCDWAMFANGCGAFAVIAMMASAETYVSRCHMLSSLFRASRERGALNEGDVVAVRAAAESRFREQGVRKSIQVLVGRKWSSPYGVEESWFHCSYSMRNCLAHRADRDRR
jgi:hypothetical protein